VGAAVSVRIYRAVWITIRLLAQLRYLGDAGANDNKTLIMRMPLFLRRNSTRGPVRVNFAKIDREC